MATTKIWVVRDDISRILGYAANPEKTSFENLKQVLMYAGDEDKTLHPIDENERALLVTGVNCSVDTAVEEMISTQKQFNKTTGIVAYHAYQSFKTGEVTPEKAHEIGVQLAKRMWDDKYQVLVATHLNTGTYHNHFVVNAVGLWDGKKFRCNKGTYFHFRALSDDLCREHRLTVIENPKGYTPRNLYFAEKRGEPTKYNLMRQALDDALEMCNTAAALHKVLARMGYDLKMESNRKYVGIKRRSEERYTRTFRLGEDYDMEKIVQRLRENDYTRARECYELQQEFLYHNTMRPFQPAHYSYNGRLKQKKKVTGLRALYLYYCYRMGWRPQRQKQQPLSPELREAWRRIDRISEQSRLLCREKLHTAEDVKAFISQTDRDMETVSQARNHIRNKMRNCKDETLMAEYKAKRDEYTEALTLMRKDRKTALGILDDVPKLRADLHMEEQLRMEERGINRKKNRGYER